MAAVDETPESGRRERKKLRLRQEISDVATRLFAERGFEQVTLAQIADAADVSVKTIFNHFGSKEDLYFDRADELRAAVTSAVTERPPGVTVLGALRALLTDNFVPFPGTGWEVLADSQRYERFRAFRATQTTSPALIAWRLRFGVTLGHHLTEVLASELARDPADPAIRALSAMLLAALSLRDDTLETAILGGAAPEELRRRVVAVVAAAFDRLETAFADLDRARGQRPRSTTARPNPAAARAGRARRRPRPR